MAFQYTCGYCGVRTIGRVKGFTTQYIDSVNERPYCLVLCDGCRSGSHISFNLNSGRQRELGSFPDDSIVIDFNDLDDADQHPIKSISVPEYLPPLLDEIYSDAESNFLEGRWKTAAQLYLQSLEFACVAIKSKGNPEAADQESAARIDLTKRINELAVEGLITSSLKEWAHHVRVIGQYHKHRYIESDQTECSELRGFVEMFLRYSISVPKQIEKRRERLKAEQS